MCLLQVEKLVHSRTLHGSESLCKLLRYLADNALKHPGIAPKEYQIATEVFGRPPDFDPHLDSVVRVQAGRLRAKLGEYYGFEGSEDRIVVELPRGVYTLAFHQASVPSKPVLPAAREPKVSTPAPAMRFSASRHIVAIYALLALAIFSFAALIFRRTASVPPAAAHEDTPTAIRTFWQGFTSGPEEPWVIFSNGTFVGRPETGLRYFDPARDSGQAILDHYTGVGEVLAVYDLEHTLARLQRQIRVKRGSLFTLDDAQNNNLIFVGSPAENLTLLDIPNMHEFVFERVTSGPRRGDLALVSLHPQPGEPKMFLSSPPGTPLTEDYAIIGLVPGLNPARSVLILAGTTTIGTQAAAEYVTREDSLERLLLRLSVSDNGAMKPFEAVLRVKVVRGVPVASELVALRKLPQ
jgi:hypothetical protein